MFSGNRILLKTKSFEFRSKHLLVILVLGIAFTTAFIMRAYPIKYGFALNEFDPFFDYRATKYIVENGITSYLNWHDTMSWYPEGRNVPTSSQVGLHISTALLYQIFGFGTSLLNFTIMFPVVIGSLTTIVIFAFVRAVSSTTAGLIASLLFAFTPSIIQRGNLGWFKSEPFGLFLGLLSVYLFISGIRNNTIKFAIAKAIGAGLFLGLANASWGGMQYLSIPISIFFFILPFIIKDFRIPLVCIILFTVTTLFTAGLFPRPGLSFVIGLPGLSIIIGTVFFVLAIIVNRISESSKSKRNMIILLGLIIAIGIGLVISGTYKGSSFRYLNAINPFLSTHNPLVQSVAEHFTPTLVDYLTDYSVLLFFAGLGAWILFRRRDDKSLFILIIGITGVYVSATFARLMVFSSIAILILASIGIYEVTRSILESKASQNTKATKSSQQQSSNKKIGKFKKIPSNIEIKSITKIAYVVIIIFLISLPTFDRGILYPPNYNWISSADVPPSIVNGGTGYRMQVEDWSNALEWISKNTPADSVIASWWDYGYWITTLGERTSLADNATINQTRIATIAKMLMSDEQTGIRIAQDLKSDYILLYVVADRFSTVNGSSFYTLGSGGDESKKQWFIRIGGFQENLYVERDGFTPTPYFWNNTLLGKLIPFSPFAYATYENGVLTNLHTQYTPGSTGIYFEDIKYPNNSNKSQPLKLVYASDSFRNQSSDMVFGVFVYQLNPDYVPDVPAITTKNTSTTTTSNQNNQVQPTSSSDTVMANIKANMTPSNEIATIETTQGTIKLEFFPYAAPEHVKNFVNLSKQGFFDNTIFHRIVKDFVIQGGDPLTKDNTNKERWGSGGPNKTISAEFNDIPHNRGILSMARTSDPNSAGSQFFIVLKDARFLDNQYTVFGRVIEGMDIVDKIASLEVNAMDQPIDIEKARIKSITITGR